MNQAPRSWLLATALVGYVALVAVGSPRSALGYAPLLAPLLVAFGLRFVRKKAESARLSTSVHGLRAFVVGLGLYAASVFGAGQSDALRTANGVAQGLLTGAALLCVARLTPPPGLLTGHPMAHSLDALGLSTVIWSAATLTALLRAVAPDQFPLDPIALDTAYLFSSLGSLLLLSASFIRVKLLRGLEMGVGDRAQAALSLAIAGTLVGTGSGLVQMDSSDQLASATLVCTTSAIVLVLAAESPSRVAMTVRGFLALLILGVPTALGGAWLNQRVHDARALLALTLTAAGIAVGLVAHRAAKPLGPEGSRWLLALTKAMDAALHPQPEAALRAALTELKRAEPTAKTRPEIFRMDPPGLLSVDIAGYLTDQEVDFPEGVLQTAWDEPSRTLRRETVEAAQVRKPSVRPLVAWFQASDAKTATALLDESGPVGLLVLPAGKRRSPLSMEEAELMGKLAERLSGLISVTSSLKRARARELDYQKQAASAHEKAALLSEQLSGQHETDHVEAARKVEILRAAAHGPAATAVLQEIETSTPASVLRLITPLGVDPVPWAAHAHLYRNDSPEPLVVMDLTEQGYRVSSQALLDPDSPSLRRARGGTLVLVYPSALSDDSQSRLAETLRKVALPFVVACLSGDKHLHRSLERVLDGPEIRLPSLRDRGEDLQALILTELTQIGLSQKGAPLGIEKAALFRLIEREYPGNDAELNGILASAAAQTDGERVLLETLDTLLFAESQNPPPVVETRRRSQRPPRTRRH